MRQNPILVGRNPSGFVKFGGSEHAALYARTGTGKSSSIVIPNCFAWRGSLVVLDVKGEAFKATAGIANKRSARMSTVRPSRRERAHPPLEPAAAGPAR